MSCPECSRRTRAMAALEVDLQNAQADVLAKMREITTLKSKITRLENEEVAEEKVKHVFAYWLDAMTRSGFVRDPARTKLGPKRDQKIRLALKLFSMEDVLHAVDGAVVDPPAYKDKIYQGIETIFRDEVQIGRLIDVWNRHEDRLLAIKLDEYERIRDAA